MARVRIIKDIEFRQTIGKHGFPDYVGVICYNIARHPIKYNHLGRAYSLPQAIQAKKRILKQDKEMKYGQRI